MLHVCVCVYIYIYIYAYHNKLPNTKLRMQQRIRQKYLKKSKIKHKTIQNSRKVLTNTHKDCFHKRFHVALEQVCRLCPRTPQAPQRFFLERPSYRLRIRCYIMHVKVHSTNKIKCNIIFMGSCTLKHVPCHFIKFSYVPLNLNLLYWKKEEFYCTDWLERRSFNISVISIVVISITCYKK